MPAVCELERKLVVAGMSVGKGDVNNTISSMLNYAQRSTRVQACAPSLHIVSSSRTSVITAPVRGSHEWTSKRMEPRCTLLCFLRKHTLYMCDCMQTLLVSPEFGEAWQSFAGKVSTHGKEMQHIANNIYYPKVWKLPLVSKVFFSGI